MMYSNVFDGKVCGDSLTFMFEVLCQLFASSNHEILHIGFIHRRELVSSVVVDSKNETREEEALRIIPNTWASWFMLRQNGFLFIILVRNEIFTERGVGEWIERRDNKNHTDCKPRLINWRIWNFRLHCDEVAFGMTRADGKLRVDRKNNQTKLTLRRTKKFDIKIK